MKDEIEFCGHLGRILARDWLDGYNQGKDDPDFDATPDGKDTTVYECGKHALDKIKSLGFDIVITKQGKANE